MRQRKRHPLDVPTPVAVALADFCRRAQAPVDPRTVRDALSLLSPDQDERVLKLSATEPLARPLGPYAVVEILERSASAHEVAERQQAGEWDHVELADVPLTPVPSPPSPAAAPQTPAAFEDPDADAPRKKRERKPSVEARIAPKHRKSGEPPPAPRTPLPRASPRYSVFVKKDLPKPRGRFTRVDLTRLKAHKLLDPHMKEELEQLIEQHGHRVAIRRALEPLYLGRKGDTLSVEDIEAALLHHELRAFIGERERTAVISAVSESRGDLARAASTLGMKPEELEHIALNSGATLELKKIREHHAREALAHGNLRLKLELMEKPKYLADLGVEKRFRDSLALELSEKLDQAMGKAADVDALVREAARREGLPYEKLKAALDRTGLAATYRRKLAS